MNSRGLLVMSTALSTMSAFMLTAMDCMMVLTESTNWISVLFVPGSADAEVYEPCV